MNQNIGISFTVSGQEKVAEGVKKIKDSLDGLSKDLKSVSDALKMDSKFDEQTKNLKSFASSIKSIAGQSTNLKAVASALEQMASATERLAQAQAGLRPFSSLVGTPGAINRATAAMNSNAGAGVTQHGGPAPAASVKTGSNSSGGALVPFVPFYQGPNWTYGNRPPDPSTGREVVASRRRPNWNMGGGYQGAKYGSVRQIADDNDYVNMSRDTDGSYSYKQGYHKKPPLYNSWFSQNFGRGQNPSWAQGSWMPGWMGSIGGMFSNMGPRFAHWAGGGSGSTVPGSGGYVKPSLGSAGGNAASGLSDGGRIGSQQGFGPMGFMLRYQGYSAGMRAAGDVARHEVMKTTLGDVAPSMQDLWAVGLTNTGDRMAARKHSFDWAAKNPHLGTAKDFLDAQGNMASALPLDLTGIKNNQKMTEIAMTAAGYTRGKTGETSEMIGKLLASRYNFMSPQKKASYQKDPSKFVNDAEYYGALIGKVVGGESIWGHGIAQHAKYMMPYWAANNIDPAEYLSVAGALSTAGIGDSAAGRGMKRKMGGDLKADAAAIYLSTADSKELANIQKLMKDKPSKVKGYLTQRSSGILQQMEEMWKTSPLSAAEATAPHYQRAKSLGFNPVLHMGYSQDFAAQTEAMFNLDNLAEQRRKATEIREYARTYGTSEQKKELDKGLGEGGYEKPKWEASKQKFWSPMEDMSRVAYGKSTMDSVTDAMNNYTNWRDGGDPAQRVAEIKRIHQTSGLQGGAGQMFMEGNPDEMIQNAVGLGDGLKYLGNTILDLYSSLKKRQVTPEMQKALDQASGLDPELLAKKNREDWDAEQKKSEEMLGKPEADKGGAGNVNVNGTVTLNIVAPPGFNVTGGGYADTGRGNAISFSTDGKGILPGTKR